MRSLTIAEACALTNIWFKVESDEQQRRFQEEFFRQGGSWVTGNTDVLLFQDCSVYELTAEGLCWCHSLDSQISEQVTVLWQEEHSLVIDSLAPEATLQVTLDTSLNWQDTLALLTQLKNEELAKNFISDKCLRKMEDTQLASLARFLLEKELEDCADISTASEIVKSFLLTTKNYLTKRTKPLEYWYKFYRKEVENIVRQCQAGLYQEELKNSPDWEWLGWERRGEE